MSLWRRVYQERRGIMLPLLILVLANVAVLAIGVLPLMQNVATLEGDAQNANMNLLKARLLERQAKEALGSKDRADVELKKFYGEILPKEEAGARHIMSFLVQTAAQNGVTLNRNSREVEEVKDSQLVRASATITLTGDYTNMRKFVYAVETAEEFVVIERVGLAQASDLRSNNRLEVNMDVATYFLATPPIP